jgi:hypothetical protein
MNLDLSTDEVVLLKELLESKHRDLLHELHHTDDRAFKEALRVRLTRLESLVAKLRVSVNASA